MKPETVFRRCVEMINHQNILPNSTLSSQIERVPATDPFHTAKRGKLIMKGKTKARTRNKTSLGSYSNLGILSLLQEIGISINNYKN